VKARLGRHARREKARHQLARDKRCDHQLVTVHNGSIPCILQASHTGPHRWLLGGKEKAEELS